MAETALPASAQLSGFWRRAAALAIDLAVLSVPFFAVGIAFFDWAVRLGLWGRAIGFVVALGYFTTMNSAITGGQTLGMRILGIKVVGRDCLPISTARSAIRYCIIAVPYFLNGVWLGRIRATPGVAYVLGPLLGLIVIGGLGSIIYLYVFNRRTQQSLHDLVTDSFVVRSASSGHIPLGLARLHLVVIGCWCLATMMAAPILVQLPIFNSAFAPLLRIQNEIAAGPDVRSAQVIAGTSNSGSTAGNSSASFLSVSAQLRGRPDNPEGVLLSIAETVLATAPDLLGKELLTANVSYGFDFGLAGWTVTKSDSGRAADWAIKEAFAAWEVADTDKAMTIFRALAAEGGLEPMAKSGNAKADIAMARIAANSGTNNGRLEALQWYRRAADQGDPDAINSIGFYYQHGLGELQQDYAKARAMFEQAAAKDWPPAINNLGLLYEKGQGVDRDYAKARELYERAAANNHAQSMINLAVMYAQGMGEPVDWAKSAAWELKAANLGSADAMYYMGIRYERSDQGVSQDYVAAKDWYERATQKGYGPAIERLGGFAFNGYVARVDYGEARRLWEVAAAKGVTRAMLELGEIYSGGKGTPKDETKASEWYSAAANAGDANGMAVLSARYSEGVGVPVDCHAALAWAQSAADKSSERGANELAKLKLDARCSN
jgi:TPR repeat protein/uncharacterized RDD family membrane protein YckC